MELTFAPGCGLYRTNKEDVDRVIKIIRTSYPNLIFKETCCKEDLNVSNDLIIVTCFGCYRRYSEVVEVTMLWDTLATLNYEFQKLDEPIKMNILHPEVVANHPSTKQAISKLCAEIGIIEDPTSENMLCYTKKALKEFPQSTHLITLIK